MSYLVVILPPPPKACDRNHGKHGIAAAGENKRARLIAKARTLETLREQGIKPHAFKPTRVEIFRLETGQKVKDWDNIAASFKHYQDGIFEALGADDSIIESGTVRKIFLPDYVFVAEPFKANGEDLKSLAGWFIVRLSGKRRRWLVDDILSYETGDLARAVRDIASEVEGGKA